MTYLTIAASPKEVSTNPGKKKPSHARPPLATRPLPRRLGRNLPPHQLRARPESLRMVPGPKLPASPRNRQSRRPHRHTRRLRPHQERRPQPRTSAPALSILVRRGKASKCPLMLGARGGRPTATEGDCAGRGFQGTKGVPDGRHGRFSRRGDDGIGAKR